MRSHKHSGSGALQVGGALAALLALSCGGGGASTPPPKVDATARDAAGPRSDGGRDGGGNGIDAAGEAGVAAGDAGLEPDEPDAAEVDVARADAAPADASRADAAAAADARLTDGPSLPSGDTGTGEPLPTPLGPVTAAGPQPKPAPACGSFPGTPVAVNTAAALQEALNAVAPGQRIELAPGVYKGEFTINNKAGQAGTPIVLCGPRSAILEGPRNTGGKPVLTMVAANRWILAGFTVRAGYKGIMLDRSNDNVLAGIEVADIGQEAVHFRDGSSRNVIRDSYVHGAGVTAPQYGEGIYVGSDYGKWQTSDAPSEGTFDKACNDNQILGNTLVGNRAEAIDIKEGTVGGRVALNWFDGTDLSCQNSADSWVDVKGNGWVIEQNDGSGTYPSGYAFELHAPSQAPGTGRDNVFRNNKGNIPGAHAGVCQSARTQNNDWNTNNVFQGAAAANGATCGNKC